MRNRFYLPLILLMALLASGCQINPRVDFANAQSAYNAAVQELINHRDQFSDEAWEEDVLPLINAGDSALDQFDVLTSAGQPADSATQTLRIVLVELSQLLETLENQ